MTGRKGWLAVGGIVILILLVCGGIFLCTVPSSGAPAAEKGAAQAAKPVQIGFDVKPPIILYVQKARPDHGPYVYYATRLLTGLCASAGSNAVTVVFWPEAPREKTDIWKGTVPDADLARFNGRLSAASDNPDAAQFEVGLRACADLADRERAQIVILANPQGASPFDLDAKDVPAQAKTLQTVSAKHLVHAIAYGLSADEYRKYVSGFAMSIYDGLASGPPESGN
jgi:hypothetical protein